MNKTLEFLVRHGVGVLFVAVFIDQLGIPLPAIPWLLFAGSLAASGQIHWLSALCAGAIGSLIADLIWFYLGRYKGRKVLDLLCRISLEPDSCVRRTQNIFTRFGMRGVVVGKFIPGLSTIIPPLAGNSGVGAGRFAFFDGLASILYVATFLVVGALFGHQLQEVLDALASLGIRAMALVVGLIAVYLGVKWYQRQQLLKELRMARITATELRQMMDAGANPLILDLRSDLELEQDPAVIPGAIHILMDEVPKRRHEFSIDREIVVYCDCPNEVSSARVALSLRRNGFVHVRPLLGGLDAWRDGNYPTERWARG